MKQSDINELLHTLVGMQHSEITNYVSPGLTSYLLGGAEGHGRVRLFNAERHQDYWIQPHSHRYNFSCLVLAGYVTNYLYKPATEDFEHADHYAIGRYDYERGELDFDANEHGFFIREAARFIPGEWYHLRADDIHSITFTRGAEVLFFEGAEVRMSNVVLQPTAGGAVIPTFRHEEWMFRH